MKNFKKFLTLVLAVMMVVSSVAFSTSAATTKFEDVDAKNETLVKAVDLLNYMGVAKGTSETTFGADELVTRQQFALFIYRLMKGGKDAPAGAANSTKFTDLEDPTYNYAIAWANAEGIVNGKSETTFAPKDGIKLQEAYAMIVRALDWEESKDLIYPFGHIEVAEQEGVELDAGLDSSVGYTDELTRADMAVLLYNAFFAETGVEEVATRERGLGPWELDDDGVTKIYTDYVLEEYTTNPRLCEKAFDVVEVEYKAVATPNYKVGDNEATYDLGYDAIYFVEVTEDDTVAPDEVYITAEDLGIDAKELNDYFLGEFTMFVTVDDEEIEKVLFADCNMVKKTVTDIKLGEVSSNKATSYFTGEDAKLLSGKLTADGEDMYVFNAPYTYASEAYTIGSDAEAKYATRNSKNLTAIDFGMTKDGDVNVYSAEISSILDTAVTLSDIAPTDDELDDGYVPFEAQATELVKAFEQVYYGGLYEADLYDVDGDGLYDYINYKPYSAFQVDADEDEYFEDSDFTGADGLSDLGLPYIYTQEATVIGEEFANEDVVIGYFSPELELVKVAAVVKPTVDTVANFKKSAGTITLGSGEKVDAVSAWKMLKNFDEEGVIFDAEDKNLTVAEASELFTTSILDDDDALELYIYDGVVLFTSEVDTIAKFTENLIIPTTLNGDKPVEKAPFNPEADNDVYYVYAWVDGATKYVQVEIDEDLTPFVTDGSSINAAYADKLCTYTEKDGLYTIYPLGTNVVDEDGDVVSEALDNENKDYEVGEEVTLTDVLDDTKKEGQWYAELSASTITKVAGSRFNVGFDRTVDFKSYTKIIIRVEDEDGDYDYVEYDASSFTKSLDEDVVLENMAVVVSNNTNSKSRENLVLLYAETDDLAFAGKADKNGYRIVSTYDIGEDADGEWRLYYSLYDPYTGKKVSDVPSAASEAKASNLDQYVVEVGAIVELIDGQVDEDEIVEAAVSVDNLVWIAEVDEAEGYFTVVPYNAGLTNKDAIDEYVEANAATAVTDIYGDAIPGNFIDYDKNTVVSVISYAKYDESNSVDLWKAGAMSLTNMSTIAAAKKEVLCYNDKATDRSGNYVTKYADYVKAYVSVDADNLDDDENPVAEFIIVVVNGQENAALDAEVLA